MTWIRLDDGWDEHPKVLAVSEPAAMLWLRAIAYSNRRKTNGYVPLGALPRLTTQPDPLAVAHELADVRVPGCRGALFDRAEQTAAGELVQLDSHEKRASAPAGGTLIGFYVHDIGDYQPRADGELPQSQGKPDLRAKRSAAGKQGAAARWHRDGRPHGNESSPPVASAIAADGTLLMANMATGALNDGTGASGAPEGPGLAQGTPRAQAGPDGTLPMATMATLPPPDPVPAPVLTHASAPARGAGPGLESGLATAAVWLAAIGPHPALALLHGDQAWARELEGTAAHRGTRAEDAEAAVLAFLDKNAGRTWHDRAELVHAFGGYAALAKKYGDDARARARAGEQHAGRVNGHQHGSRAQQHKGPPPNPRGAVQLDLDTGDGGRSK